jgi:hypothetical protein
LWSNALGGIKLMVDAENAERAIEILAEEGYTAKKEKDALDFLPKLYAFTARLPLIGQLKFETRFFILVTLLILLFAIVGYFFAI